MNADYNDLESCLTTDGKARLAAAGPTLNANGYVHAAGVVSPDFCAALIDAIRGAEFIEVQRADRRGDTHFYTINGSDLASRMPIMADLYQHIGAVASNLAGTQLRGLKDLRIGLSLNCTPPGGGFVRHFDRNEISASVMLNSVEGGSLELWPNILSAPMQALGRLTNRAVMQLSRFRRPLSIPAARGDIVFFSRRTLHGVSPIEGARSRVSLIMAYDLPGISSAEDRDYYGRAEKRVTLERIDA